MTTRPGRPTSSCLNLIDWKGYVSAQPPAPPPCIYRHRHLSHPDWTPPQHRRLDLAQGQSGFKREPVVTEQLSLRAFASRVGIWTKAGGPSPAFQDQSESLTFSSNPMMDDVSPSRCMRSPRSSHAFSMCMVVPVLLHSTVTVIVLLL
jgi:hypothetical protein